MKSGLILGLAALAGCSGAGPHAAATPTPSPGASYKPITSRGWSDVWTTPATVVNTFARLSFRPSPYQSAGARSRSESTPPIVLADPAKGDANTLMLAIEGTAERVDTLRFVLNLTDEATAAVAKQRFAEQVQMAGRQLGVTGAEPATAAAVAETPKAGETEGARWAVLRKPLTGTGRQVTVTFSAPDATGTAS